jgi:phage gpG-like protein
MKIPARPYLGLSEKNSDEIVGIINEYVMGSR